MGYKGVVLLSPVLLASYISSFDGRNPLDSYCDIKKWNLSILSSLITSLQEDPKVWQILDLSISLSSKYTSSHMLVLFFNLLHSKYALLSKGVNTRVVVGALI
eukprot:TRINITY_DN369_c1_g1_i1.p1 TRINITY_DN369_c1_g1~~TRINITY_DN369_c1_g1_i1.p1  ORF type:complete len:103 (+),score=3.60 TRINITY_DN369_c1_g1_i1:105-413(+)